MSEPFDINNRVEEEVGSDLGYQSSKPKIPFVQSTAQMPRKGTGRARLVVEFFFDFSPEFLKRNDCPDGVDYVRRIRDGLQASEITLDDVETLVRAHGDLDWRIEAAK